MLGHLSIGARDLAAAGRFYDAMLAPMVCSELQPHPALHVSSRA